MKTLTIPDGADVSVTFLRKNDGYDGHCLRAFNYFGDQMTGIDSTPSSINSIKKLYGDLRDESKAPTFLLTYQGTFHGLMKNLGWTKEKALRIEKAYHDMYRVSDEWVADKIKQACRDGYVTVAFGLRVRTPLLKKVILGTSKTPFAAEAEGRTAGNALGQSYCLLNNRAGVQLQEETLASEYAEDIQPAAHIHDAQYFMVRDNFHTVKWLNEHLGNAMQWQELPEIQHPDVKLSGELDIFYPSWKYGCTIPNGASIQQIYQSCNEHMDDLLEQKAA